MKSKLNKSGIFPTFLKERCESMLKEEQVLKMYNSKMEHVAMAVYSPKEFESLLKAMQDFGGFTKEQADTYLTCLEASTKTMALILGRRWDRDLKSYENSF